MVKDFGEAQRFAFDLGPDSAPGLKPLAKTRKRTANQTQTTKTDALAIPDENMDLDGLNVDLANQTATCDPLLDDVETGDNQPAALTIASFYEHLKRAVRSAFTGEVWVVGEIRKIHESKGHHYLELADAGVGANGSVESSRTPVQQLEVVCWARDWPRVDRELARAGATLELGQVVRVCGKVTIWEGAGKIRFTLTAIDIDALLGGIAAARRRLIDALVAQDLFDANRRLALPMPPLRIGIVASPGTEGHRDFCGQLERSGFAFAVTLQPCLVQGTEAPRQIARAIENLANTPVDIVVVIRGGGARGDLAAFDSEEVALAIANAPFCVWTGIGHTGDRSVADDIANASYSTPTACGEAVVAQVRKYWDSIVGQAATISKLSANHIGTADLRLARNRLGLSGAVRHQLDRRNDGLVTARDRTVKLVQSQLELSRKEVVRRAATVASLTKRAIESELVQLRRRRELLAAFDPSRQYKRGWSVATDENGCVITLAASVKDGQRLFSRFADGEVGSVIDVGLMTQREA